MFWNFKSAQVPHTEDEVRTILLSNRHVEDELKFFAPPSPLELSLTEVGIDEAQMAKSVARILQARDRQEDVMVFGDYDADGVCATAVLWEGLKSVGIVARPFIPHREKHGYGLSERALAEILAGKKPDLLVTVDNGIVAHTAFQKLQEVGVDAILTDHHQPESSLPPAFSIVHTPQLCGTTVAWFLARELDREAATRSLDLTAVATVTDQMSLIGVNRSFVTHGLEALRHTHRIGLQLLAAKAELNLAEVKVDSINYGIGPRLNAMGRLKHGMDALRLLCTTSQTRAEELVAELNQTNTTRQDLTQEMVIHARQQAELLPDERIIVVSSSEYHEGVIGLIAGKLMEEFYKPAIAISVGEKVAKASARSVPGINIIDLIRELQADLLEAGGHPMAAGFGLLSEKVELVSRKFRQLAEEKISLELLKPSIEIECELPAELVSLSTAELIETFAPFGPGNRAPVFAITNAMLLGVDTIGKEARHLKLQVRLTLPDNTLIEVTGLAWNQAHLLDQLELGSSVNLAATLEANRWKNKTRLQLVVKHIQIA